MYGYCRFGCLLLLLKLLLLTLTLTTRLQQLRHCLCHCCPKR